MKRRGVFWKCFRRVHEGLMNGCARSNNGGTNSSSLKKLVITLIFIILIGNKTKEHQFLPPKQFYYTPDANSYPDIYF